MKFVTEKEIQRGRKTCGENERDSRESESSTGKSIGRYKKICR